MKIQYFEDTDTLYIELSSAPVDDTRDLDEDTLLEVDAAGRLCAITIEHARERTAEHAPDPAAMPVFPYELIPAVASPVASPLPSPPSA